MQAIIVKMIVTFFNPISFAVSAVIVLVGPRHLGTVLVAACVEAIFAGVIVNLVVPGSEIGLGLVPAFAVGLAHAGLVYWLRGLRKKNGHTCQNDGTGS